MGTKSDFLKAFLLCSAMGAMVYGASAYQCRIMRNIDKEAYIARQLRESMEQYKARNDSLYLAKQKELK